MCSAISENNGNMYMKGAAVLTDKSLSCSCTGYSMPEERFPQSTPLAMAYVPYQKWENTYPENTALAAGTIFPSLCLPFTGNRGGMKK